MLIGVPVLLENSIDKALVVLISVWKVKTHLLSLLVSGPTNT